jgi:hypothetical protein
MKVIVTVIVAGVAIALAASSAMAQGKKSAKTSAQPACLNTLACGPQPVRQIRKPKSEKFMKSAS